MARRQNYPDRDTASPALRQILDLLWCRPGGGRVAVTLGRELPSTEFSSRPVETYVALPTASTARFVVPTSSRRAAIGSVLRYNRLRDPRTRMARLATSVVLALRAEQLTGGTCVRVWVTRGDETPLTLRDHLSRELSRPDIALAFGVHPLDPNYKPTLQVFDRRGSALAFVKVGWTRPTARLVENEARAVRSMTRPMQDRRTVPEVETPELLAETSWQGLHLTCLRPLPASVRRYTSAAIPGGAPLHRITGPANTMRVLDSSWWQRVRDRINALIADRSMPADVIASVQDYAAAVSRPNPCLAMAAWHGDWVPWNLAVEGSATHVFDLEHWAPCAPCGFDLAHWAFQTALVGEGRSAAESIVAADASTLTWPASDVINGTERYVVSLYLLELAIRTLVLRADGGLWNDRLYPDLFALLPRRVVAG